MALNKKQRAEVKRLFGGRCAYCGCSLGDKWHADHVEPLIRILRWRRSTNDSPGKFVFMGDCHRPEAERFENYFPACVPCNIDKGACPLEGWREWLNERIVDGLRKNCSTFRHAERFGRVVITKEPLVFWFEKYLEEKKSDET